MKKITSILLVVLLLFAFIPAVNASTMDAKDEYTPPTIDELKVLFPEANLDEKEIMKASKEYTKKILESKDNIIVDEKPVATYFYEDGPHRIY